MADITIRPGTTIVARATGWPTGLVGTMGVELVDIVADTVVVARTTTGIVEFEPGEYRAVIPGPTVVGRYVPVFDDGGTPPIEVADEFTWVVAYSAIQPGVAAGGSIPTPHTAARVWIESDNNPDTWVDGQPDESEQQSPAFGCFLQLPRGDETGGPGGRRVKRPALMFPPPADGTRLDGADEVLVTAADLTGPDPVRWQVVGSPAASGPPGGPTIVFEATLARVEAKGKAA